MSRFATARLFLIPLGPPTNDFDALFYYPRSPALSLNDIWFQAVGFIFVGASIAWVALGSRLRTKAGQLRERINLFRSMQIAFLQVDRDDWILEANDRAEELFQRQLPKPGVTRHKVNFAHLIKARLVATDKDGPGEATSQYAELTNDAIKSMRKRGEASSYFARLAGNDPIGGMQPLGKAPRWLRVSATPMMDIHEEATTVESVRLGSISATAYEVPAEIAERLEKKLQEIIGQEKERWLK